MTAAPEPGVPDADVLDCLTGNLAMMLARAGDPDPLRLLGGQCTFGLTEEPLPLPVLTHTDPLAAMTASEPAGPAELEALVAARGDVLVFADAYALPWLPMHGRQHVEHTVVVTAVRDGQAHLSDAYTADTEWGEARPVTAVLEADHLACLLAAHAGRHRPTAFTLPDGPRPEAPAMAEAIRANARAMAATVLTTRTVAGFAASYREIGADLDGWRRFELGCWMASRARAAYARHLGRAGAGAPAALAEAALLAARTWQQAARVAYVTRRRVTAGRDPGAALADEIATTVHQRERELAMRLGKEAQR